MTILNSYKFTIAENTPLEEEIALDPELLGKVFENLLASYNPETQTTARKQTGSFYTPREIVNYMVDESLLAYLSNVLQRSGNNGQEPRLRQLIAEHDVPHQFSSEETHTLIQAIDNAKILDPACGSGAFPMGILHKMVHLLSKLDPHNVEWKERQIAKVQKMIEDAERIDDTRIREQVLGDLENSIKSIEDAFQNNELDYGRKLYLIENCIYGVDIQPIAVQIAKLRFFISLIVDQKINPDQPNLGIRPLPNLETKFVAANTLIGIEKPQQLLLRNPNIDKKEHELKQVRQRHFEARTPKTKEKYRKEDERLRHVLADLLKQDGFPSETTEKLAQWNPYDQNASAGFFDPEWMFGIQDGFNVVLGNPPYGFHQIHSKSAKSYFKNHYASSKGSFEHYFLFYEAGLKLLNQEGGLVFIAPVTWLTIPSARSLRKFILSEYFMKEICWLSEKVFEQASVNTLISLIQVNQIDDVTVKIYDSLDAFPFEPTNQQRFKQESFVNSDYYIAIFETKEDCNILEKILKESLPLSTYARPCSGYNPYEVGKGQTPEGTPHTKETVKSKPYHSTKKMGDDWKPEIIGRALGRYTLSVTGKRWVKYGAWLAAPRDPNNFLGKRILVQEITGGKDKRIIAAYCDQELYHSRDVIPT